MKTDSLQAKARKILFNVIDSYIQQCIETYYATAYKGQKKNFCLLYEQSKGYFSAIRHTDDYKKMISQVLIAKKYLEDILPLESSPYFKLLQRQCNYIVQFCVNEKNTRSKISSINAKEILTII
jgi:hypothetical protein